MQASPSDKLDHKNSKQFIKRSHAFPTRNQGTEKTLQTTNVLKIPIKNTKTPEKHNTQQIPENDLKTIQNKSSHTPDIRSQTDHLSRYTEMEKMIFNRIRRRYF